MISQKCPKCRSKRIRRGYRPTPLWSKFFMRYNLLCDSCNLEFRGFALPGTLNSRTKRKTRRPVRTEVSPFMVLDNPRAVTESSNKKRETKNKPVLNVRAAEPGSNRTANEMTEPKMAE